MSKLLRLAMICTAALALAGCWQANYALFYVSDSAQPDIDGTWEVTSASYHPTTTQMPKKFRLSRAAKGGFMLSSLDPKVSGKDQQLVLIPLRLEDVYIVGVRTSTGSRGERWVYNLLRLEGSKALLVEGKCSKDAVAGISGTGAGCTARHGTPMLAAAYDQLSKPGAWTSATQLQRIAR
ncbi:MAG: hypothetical protein H6918_05015 [Sphingomonadaceae bacterium]|nr:hypothetical protein [Sphingomonadaceae bacterium]